MKNKIIFLPALMCDERLFTHQKLFLEEKCGVKCEIILFKDQKNISEAANFVLNENKEDFYLVGNSMGGYVAMEILKIAPSRVKKLCLMGTSFLEEGEEKSLSRKAGILKAEESKSFSFSQSAVSSMVYKEGSIAVLKDMCNTLGYKTYINQQKIIMSRSNYKEALNKFNKPSLVIYGKFDKITNDVIHKEIAANLKDSKLIEIDNAGHLIGLDQKEALTALLEYFIYED